MQLLSLTRCLVLVVACLACLAFAAPKKPDVLKNTHKYGRWNIELTMMGSENGTITHVITALWKRRRPVPSGDTWDTKVGCKFVYPKPSDRSVRVGHCSDESFQYTFRDRSFAVVQTVQRKDKPKKGSKRVAGVWDELRASDFNGTAEVYGLHGQDKRVHFNGGKRIIVQGPGHEVKSADHEFALHDLPGGVLGEPALGNAPASGNAL